MKDEPALSLCREIWPSFKSGISGSISLEAEITGSFSIHIPEGKLHFRRLWKVGLPLQSKTGNQLSSPDDMRCMQISSRFFNETDDLLSLHGCLRESLDFTKGCQDTFCKLFGTRWGYAPSAGEKCFILS